MCDVICFFCFAKTNFMRATCLFAFMMLSCIFDLDAQDLGALTAKLQQTIEPVQTASKKYEPKLESVQPGVLRYSYNEVDQKGNGTAYLYEFNLADIDPYAVREVTQKDAIFSVLTVRNKQKLVKVTKNEEVQPYDIEVSIIAGDIESARTLSEVVKKAIPLAEKAAASRLKVTGYDGTMNWLAANVSDVTLGTKSFKQTLSRGDKPGVLIFKVVESDGKNSTEEIYSLNIADLNANMINYKISGNRFALDIETMQKARFIHLRKDGQVRPFVSSFSINTNDVDEARDLKTVLAMAIPLAKEKVKADLPGVSTEKEGLQKIKALVGEVDYGSKQVTQTMEPLCYCTLTHTERDAKSTEVNAYKFNWMDINPNTSNIDVTGERMFIVLDMVDKRRVIMHSKDDKFDGYENDLRIFFADMESARRAKAAVDKVSEKCKAAYKEPFGADTKSIVAWLISNVKEVTLDDITYKQTLSPVEQGNNSKLKFTRQEINSKGSGNEEVYEFALADVNPLAVDVAVQGKWLYVTLESDFKNKIFNYYKDGKIQPYQSTIRFAVNDTESARNMVSALKKSSKALKPK